MRYENSVESRDVYFDNLKFALIVLVVVGHFLLPMEKTRLVNNLFYLIYTFHMPCFVLVSGYFSKNVYREGRFRADKLFQILWLYLVFKVLTHITEGLVAGNISLYIDFFTESGAPWYLLSMALWYLTLPVVCQMRPGTVLGGSVIVSLLAGYETSVGYFLSMSRTLTFAPFFYFGYYLSGESVRRFLRSKGRRAVLPAAALLAGLLFLTAYDRLMPYAQIVYGTGYGKLSEGLYLYGPAVRLLWYGAAALLSAGLMAAVPERRTIFSDIGRRTLQIYILHRLIRDLAQYWGWYERINVHSKPQVAGVVAFSLALTVALGSRCLEPVFLWIKELPGRLRNSSR